MRNSRKLLIGLFLWSLLAGVLGTWCVYRYFPEYLCYTVHDVHESDLYERIVKEVEPNARYREHFIPRYGYLKSIVLYVDSRTGEAALYGDSSERDASGRDASIEGKLLDGSGRILAVGKVAPDDRKGSSLCEFPLETWVKTDRQYQFLITFPDCGGLELTFGPGDIGPSEHIALFAEEGELGESLYMRYVYGSYSRKLLLIWFVMFFMAAFWLGKTKVK